MNLEDINRNQFPTKKLRNRGNKMDKKFLDGDVEENKCTIHSIVETTNFSSECPVSCMNKEIECT
jgi:hypothetical protein